MTGDFVHRRRSEHCIRVLAGGVEKILTNANVGNSCDLTCLEVECTVYSYCQIAFLRKFHNVLHLSMFRGENYVITH